MRSPNERTPTASSHNIASCTMPVHYDGMIIPITIFIRLLLLLFLWSFIVMNCTIWPPSHRWAVAAAVCRAYTCACVRACVRVCEYLFVPARRGACTLMSRNAREIERKVYGSRENIDFEFCAPPLNQALGNAYSPRPESLTLCATR